MSSVDERVVEMKFNNGQFQKGVAESSKGLDALKKSLNLDGAKNSLKGLADAGAKFSLGHIANGVQDMASKFTTLGIIGVTALVNITNQAVNAGLQVAKSLTIAPIMDGFREYELKMGSIQTILANTQSKGTTLDQVTASLDELNNYADKTIYNFGDMTKNIGLFTNAGIGIEDATSMIKGFSNSAAASGTNSQAAAGAAYQLSQALSAGKITLMDWRSLQNAGMGNKNMQNGILDIANAMGTLEGKGITSEEIQKNFNGSLEKGWLTADVMSKYLNIMAGDMDAAAMSALGLSDAQIKNFSMQQKTAEEAATKVRTFTQLMGTMKEAVGSSWSESFDLIVGDFNEATDLFTNVSNTVGGIIGDMGKARNDLIKNWDAGGGRTIAIEAVSNAFKALMAIIKPITEAFQEVFPPATASDLIRITDAVRDFTAGLIPTEAAAANIKAIFKGLFATVSIGAQIFGGLVSVIVKIVTAIFSLIGPILRIAQAFMEPRTEMDEFLKSGNKVGNFFDGINKLIEKPLGFLTQFAEKMAQAVEAMDFDGASAMAGVLAPLGAIGGAIAFAWEKVVVAFQAVKKFVAPIATELGNFFRDMGKSVGSFFDEFGPTIEEAFKNLDFGLILKTLEVGLFGGLVLTIKNFLGNIGNKTKDAGGGFLDNIKGMQNTLRSGTLIAIGVALALLAGAIFTLAQIDPGRLTSSLTAMSVMFVQLFASMAIFEKIAGAKGFANITVVTGAMILLAIAVRILAGAVTELSALDWNELAKGLTGVTVLLGALAGAAKLLSGNAGGMISAGIGLVILAAAIKILVSAVTDLSGLSWEELAKGLGSVGALLTALVLFQRFSAAGKGAVGQAVMILILAASLKVLASAVADFGALDANVLAQGMLAIGAVLLGVQAFGKATAKMGNMIVMAAGLVVLGVAMKIFASAVADFGQLSWDEIGRGLVAMGGALVIVAIAMSMMPGNMIVTAAGLVVVGFALGLVADAFKKMGGMTWDEIGRGMVVLAGSLILLAAAMYVMTGAIVGAAALIVAAGALMILAPALVLLGTMSWDAIGRGLTMLAASLVIIAAGGLLLTVALPGLLGLGAAVLLIGMGAMLAGVGIGLFATGLAALGAAAAVSVPALTSALMAIIDLIPYALQQLAVGIVGFAAIIAESGPTMVEAFTTLLMSMITAIGTLVPQIVETLTDILVKFLDSIVVLAPKIIDTVTVLIISLVDAITILVPKFVTAGVKIVTGILNGIANNIAKLVTAGVKIVTEFLRGVGDNIPKIIQAGVDLILKFVNGLADGIRNNTAKMNEAGQNLADAIVDGMISGITSGISSVINAAKNLAESALNAAKNFLGIASPSKEFTKLGAWSSEGMANGIRALIGKVTSASKDVGKAALTTMSSAMIKVAEAVQGDIDMTPRIRPVLDLSAIQRDSGLIPGMLTASQLSVDASYDAAATVSVDPPTGPNERFTPSETAPPVSKEIKFEQHITSPKAISEPEIYRNTKNLISQTKDLLEI
jgi:tape measure domain-containing protein